MPTTNGVALTLQRINDHEGCRCPIESRIRIYADAGSIVFVECIDTRGACGLYAIP